MTTPPTKKLNAKAIAANWFSGKGYENAKHALAMLNECIVEDGWKPRYSMKIKAAINKIDGATQELGRLADKFASDAPKSFDRETYAPTGARREWGTISWAFRWGGKVDGMKAAVAALEAVGVQPEQKALLEKAKQFVADFEPVYSAIAYLDALRPKPVYVMGTLSPTGAKYLAEGGFKPETTRLPVFIHHRKQLENGDWVFWTEIVWPAGIKHNATRFGKVGCSRSGNMQCHACGHAIKNGFNWVPLVIDNAEGVPHSFWVGKDCAKKLFGVDMKGEAEYKNTEGR